MYFVMDAISLISISFKVNFYSSTFAILLIITAISLKVSFDCSYEILFLSSTDSSAIQYLFKIRPWIMVSSSMMDFLDSLNYKTCGLVIYPGNPLMKSSTSSIGISLSACLLWNFKHLVQEALDEVHVSSKHNYVNF